MRCVRMGCVNDQVKRAFLQQVFDAVIWKPACQDSDIVIAIEHGLTIFGGHAGRGADGLCGKIFNQLTSLGRAGKHTQVIHRGTLWV